jgi:hypothetical protein
MYDDLITIQHSLEDTVGNMLVMARHVFMPFILISCLLFRLEDSPQMRVSSGGSFLYHIGWALGNGWV